jgi:1-phosphatidylinositol-4-phosphate 5-kinase
MEIASQLLQTALKEVKDSAQSSLQKLRLQIQSYQKPPQTQGMQNVHHPPVKKPSKIVQQIKTKLKDNVHDVGEIEVANVKGSKIQFKEPLQPQRNPPRNLVHPGHQSFNIVFNIMLGIKKSVDATLDIPLIHITDKDFLIKCKYEIAPYRTEANDNVKACTFFDYAPQIFANIRRCQNISKREYSESLGPEQILGYIFNANFRSLSELCSSGKSGSFFYYTQD